MGVLGVSERRTCRVLGQHRSTQRKAPQPAGDEAQLTAAIIVLAKQYGRYGYRRITVELSRQSRLRTRCTHHH
jgi:putative transposase